MRTSTSIEVLVILLLSQIPWPGPSVFRISCSRDDAKLVRKIVQSKWIPLLDKYQVKLPLECPFHPLRDIFGPQHAAKHQHRPSQWSCGLCGKAFYEERFLDMHFDSRHRDHVNKAEDAVCLADYCDIMRCQVLVSQAANLAGGGPPSTDVELWKDAAAERSALVPAAPTHVARLPAREQARRRRRVQNNDNCPKNVRPEHDTEERDENEGEADEANHTAELCDADTVESAFPPDNRHQRLSDIQRLKASCDPQHLQTLKVRCEQLVHDCISTLLLHLTAQHFKEIEEEMKRAVCWYLSCDRYWQDAVASVRAFPWPLVLGATGLLTLAVCMCYYIIWIVFDSEDGSVIGSASASLTAHSSPSRAADSHMGEGDAMEPGEDPGDHYIYVTYPPDLKRRLLERYERREISVLVLTPLKAPTDNP